jgi:hypothetical protein
MRDGDGVALRSTLADLFTTPFDDPLDDDAFNMTALRVFARQHERNLLYAAFCERRGRTPATVTHWTQIPPVPTAAFREAALVAGDVASAEAVFRTSGTTRGAERRGVHYVPDLAVYHMSLEASFTACLLPDGASPHMLSLMPPASELPDSSLAHMIDVVLRMSGHPMGAHYASIDTGLDTVGLEQALRDPGRTCEPVCLLGTSSAFVRWLDDLAGSGRRFRLPPGSRLMDTGGYKGHGRQVDDTALRGMYSALLGLPASHCVNEYGMTEMLSQFYDSTLRDAVLGRSGDRRKLVPPWVRTRIVDAETLEPVQVGQTGLLQHFDLANAGSVVAIQTEDLGVAAADGFRVLGRAAGATPRGCSVAMDLLLDAVADRRG